MSSRLFHPLGEYTRTPTSIVILHRGPSPTADIYFRPRFEGCGLPVRYVDIDAPPVQEDVFAEGAFVIIVRYLNGVYAARLKARQDRLSGVAYLMDDDIPGVLDDSALPRGYAWKLALHYRRWKGVLSRLASEVWLSSPSLLERYGGDERILHINPMYIPPGPAVAERAPDEGKISIFYHGERTHLADTMWLRDIVARVQQEHPHTVFEVVGRVDVKRAYHGIERVRVLHPMSWDNYLNYSQLERGHIGLAPLGGNSFNRYRSINKIFDITRMGAAAVLADRSPYTEALEHDVQACLVPHEAEAWIEAILGLAKDAGKRAALHAGARAFCEEHNRKERENPVTARFMA